MQSIIIDEEFRSLLPVLDQSIYESLEENLITNGCRDAIILWNGILIDGHNRYEICTKNDIPFNTVNKDFASREEALIWIISNQVSRRNLTQIQLSHYRGLHYMANKKIVKNDGGKNQYSEVNRQNGGKAQGYLTARDIAQQYRVSQRTVERDAKVAKALGALGEISMSAQRKVLSGEIDIDKKVLEGLSSKPKEEIEALAAEIEEGTYEKKAPAKPAPQDGNGNDDHGFGKVWQLDTIVRDLADDFC
jgi:hypothetical protein